jgi:hypothetical protein
MIIETAHPSSKTAEDQKSDLKLAVGNSNKLSHVEASLLARCESAIAGSSTDDSVMPLGLALAEILEKKLYREHFGSFGGYCLRRWKISRCHAHRQINAAKTLQHLLTLGTIPLPGGDKELVYAPLGTPEADAYLDDMALGANFAT